MGRARSLLTLCLFLAGSLSAQQTASAPPATTTVSDPRALALVQQSFAALASGTSISDVTLTGNAHRTIGSDDENGPITLEATAAGDSRVGFNFPSGNRIEIRNTSAVPPAGGLPPSLPATVAQTSQPVGAWSEADGILHEMAQHNLQTDPTWFFPEFTIGRLVTSSNYILSYLGQGEYDNQNALRVSASAAISQGASQMAALQQHLSQMELYLDPNSLLPIALAFDVHPDDNAAVDIPTRIEFSSYQQVDGAKIPFHLQKYVNNVLVLDIQCERAVVNSGLATSDFQVQ